MRNILDFPDRFSPPARVALQENYRSTQAILAASNAVIGLARPLTFFDGIGHTGSGPPSTICPLVTRELSHNASMH